MSSFKKYQNKNDRHIININYLYLSKFQLKEYYIIHCIPY